MFMELSAGKIVLEVSRSISSSRPLFRRVVQGKATHLFGINPVKTKQRLVLSEGEFIKPVSYKESQ